MASTRRLAAILAADVAGYSRLMEADEEGTHERLRAHFRELVDPKIEEYHGRTVKHTGDGILAEFPSVMDAVRSAVEVQRGMIKREPEVCEEQRIRFRIGVNLGDVIVEKHDIFGDGVNVAARLEALAEPGGICVSRMVKDQIRDKLLYPFDDMGEQSVKNIARPVRAYTLRPEAIADLPLSGMPVSVPHRRPIVRPPIVAAVAAVDLVIAAGAWWLWPAAKTSPTPAAGPTTSLAQPLVAPRLSIVVLPFTNLSNDPDQQYFADGITEDVTTDLSRIPHMLVISHNTALAYRNQPIDAKQIGRELGVRYIFEGSVQRSGPQVRVNTQLIDAETDAHLWADRFDRPKGDLFVLQNEITRRIAIALNAELIAAEAARPTNNPDALDYILRGRAALYPYTPDSYVKAVRLFERALALDPGSVDAQSWLAIALVGRVFNTITVSFVAEAERGKGSPGRDRIATQPTSTGRQGSVFAADVERAKGLAEQVLAVSPRNPLAHYAKGELSRLERRCGDAIPEYEMAIMAWPNWMSPIRQMAACKFYTGSGDAVIPFFEQVIRLSPRDPSAGANYFWIGVVHLFQTRTAEAIMWLEWARNALPETAPPHYLLASAYGIAGKLDSAARELADARRLDITDRYTTIARVKANGDLNTPALHERFESVFLVGLRKAGMPEE